MLFVLISMMGLIEMRVKIKLEGHMLFKRENPTLKLKMADDKLTMMIRNPIWRLTSSDAIPSSFHLPILTTPQTRP